MDRPAFGYSTGSRSPLSVIPKPGRDSAPQETAPFHTVKEAQSVVHYPKTAQSRRRSQSHRERAPDSRFGIGFPLNMPKGMGVLMVAFLSPANVAVASVEAADLGHVVRAAILGRTIASASLVAWTPLQAVSPVFTIPLVLAGLRDTLIEPRPASVPTPVAAVAAVAW